MEKLSLERKRKGYTQEELARILGVSKQLISAWENNYAPIDPKHFDKLKTALNLSEQEMLNIVAENTFANAQQETEDKRLIRKMRKAAGNAKIAEEKGCLVPVVSLASAASYNPGLMPLIDCIQRDSENRLWFKNARQDDFAIEVTGSSMSPWYPEGTMLLVRPYQEIQNGKRVVAVLDTGEILFKVYAKKDKKIHLFSIDGNGIDFTFSESGQGIEGTAESLRYICRVVASIRNEDDLDEAMHESGIVHFWVEKLKNS